MKIEDKVEELLEWRDELMLNNAEWARLTSNGTRGVSYQTIRRMELGSCNPRTSTLRALEAALNQEAAHRRNGHGHG